MLEWTAEGGAAHFMAFVGHTKGKRECVCDWESKVWQLYKTLDGASAKGWTVGDMKRD